MQGRRSTTRAVLESIGETETAEPPKAHSLVSKRDMRRSVLLVLLGALWAQCSSAGDGPFPSPPFFERDLALFFNGDLTFQPDWDCRGVPSPHPKLHWNTLRQQLLQLYPPFNDADTNTSPEQRKGLFAEVRGATEIGQLFLVLDLNATRAPHRSQGALQTRHCPLGAFASWLFQSVHPPDGIMGDGVEAFQRYMHSSAHTIHQTIKQLSIDEITGTTWPILRLLIALDKGWAKTSVNDCFHHPHPSVDWRQFQADAQSLAKKVIASGSLATYAEDHAAVSQSGTILFLTTSRAPWNLSVADSMALLTGNSTPSTNSTAHGNTTVATTIGRLTLACPLGSATALLLQALGTAALRDMHRLLQVKMAIVRQHLTDIHATAVFSSGWPIFELLLIIGEQRSHRNCRPIPLQDLMPFHRFPVPADILSTLRGLHPLQMRQQLLPWLAHRSAPLRNLTDALSAAALLALPVPAHAAGAADGRLVYITLAASDAVIPFFPLWWGRQIHILGLLNTVVITRSQAAYHACIEGRKAALAPPRLAGVFIATERGRTTIEELGTCVLLPYGDGNGEVCAREEEVRKGNLWGAFPDTAAALVKYSVLLVGAQFGLRMVWFDMDVMWVRDPTRLIVQRAKDGAAGENDLLVLEELFTDDARDEIIYVGNTGASDVFLGVLLSLIMGFPFAAPNKMLNALIRPQTVAFSGVPRQLALDLRQRIRVGMLDPQESFASRQGWFGDLDNVYAFATFQREEDWPAIEHSIMDLFSPSVRCKTAVHLLRNLAAASSTTTAQQHHEQLARNDTGTALNDTVGDGCFRATVLETHKVLLFILDTFFRNRTPKQPLFSTAADKRKQALLGETRKLLEREEAFRHGRENATDLLPTADDPMNATYVSLPYGNLTVLSVSYADGCCEMEQEQNHRTALEWGCTDAWMLNGTFLDVDFPEKNRLLLEFPREGDLIRYKSPSAKRGYYVWKPYVVLKALLSPDLPWYRGVLVYSDAGGYFVGPIQSLVDTYLNGSDVVAFQDFMLEGDWTKRDAFLALDADHIAIALSQQYATGIILMRKTPLAVSLAHSWLKACQDRRVMTEEPSVMGQPDYPGFKNHNDDQSAFSLLFKLYGFRGFSVITRDKHIHFARNKKKFELRAEATAQGRRLGVDDYLTQTTAALQEAIKR
ncbi:unnamed protein product [Vitrella brassicaformis CCMP3155]|uniref:Nucleotide-diphospho-sugar transferase domain-containing protein n=1 Tax=Vitrella brassicaformis (strain CCMP3155) TaxID=1169540 RepID=A0A0G4EP13_VITBC|nr:unnamed protein product [Vitrella brassicaformis CCMP3155]|eukprot:CEL99550.1 unnamed protein product [Vitrella brassicaformis CCMP3155]